MMKKIGFHLHYLAHYEQTIPRHKLTCDQEKYRLLNIHLLFLESIHFID